jgi:hypothetical protein
VWPSNHGERGRERGHFGSPLLPAHRLREKWTRCRRAQLPGAGLLWDVLFLLRLAIGRGSGTVVHFGVHVRNDNREGTPPLVRLKAAPTRERLLPR